MAKISLSAYVSSEANYDYGGAYVGTSIYKPTRDQIKNKTTDGNGEWIFSQSGTSNSLTEYSVELDREKEYYLSFAYAKDGSGNSGADRLVIEKIILRRARGVL